MHSWKASLSPNYLIYLQTHPGKFHIHYLDEAQVLIVDRMHVLLYFVMISRFVSGKANQVRARAPEQRNARVPVQGQGQGIQNVVVLPKLEPR